jgi:uncharacterized OB-fold protein
MMVPARDFCELCDLQTVQRYYDLPDTGTVRTFTRSYVDWASAPLPDNGCNVFAVIAIDGCPEDMGLVHLVGECDPMDVDIGMRVKAVWKKEEDREGTVLDIAYWRPMKEGDVVTEPVPIKPVELDASTAKAFPGKIPLAFHYTAGLAGRAFYEGLAKGKVIGTECCDKVVIPPAAFCEDTLELNDTVADAVEIEGDGMVYGFTIVHEDRSGHELDEPQVVVQVGYPGVEGSVFGRLEVEDGMTLHVGMLVAVVPSEETGPEHVWFKPIAAE